MTSGKTIQSCAVEVSGDSRRPHIAAGAELSLALAELRAADSTREGIDAVHLVSHGYEPRDDLGREDLGHAQRLRSFGVHPGSDRQVPRAGAEVDQALASLGADADDLAAPRKSDGDDPG